MEVRLTKHVTHTAKFLKIAEMFMSAVRKRCFCVQHKISQTMPDHFGHLLDISVRGNAATGAIVHNLIEC